MAEKTGFVFPGQGAQFVGMGKDHYDSYPQIRYIYEKASNILGMDVAALCFDSTEEELRKTENTQVAIFITQVALLAALKLQGIKDAECSIGISLGEFTSLYYGGVLDFESTVKFLRTRGEYMSKYIEPGNYGMISITGLSYDTVEQICNNQQGFIVPAICVSPRQASISGDLPTLRNSIASFEDAGAEKLKLINVTMPFHTQKLEQATTMLRPELEKVSFKKPQTTIYRCLDGEKYSDTDNFADILSHNVTMPLRVDKGIASMLNDGVTNFIIFGPGSGESMKSFINDANTNNRDINIYSAEALAKRPKSK